jgi:hypothetical protein
MIFRRILEWAREHHFLVGSAVILIVAIAVFLKACQGWWPV